MPRNGVWGRCLLRGREWYEWGFQVEMGRLIYNVLFLYGFDMISIIKAFGGRSFLVGYLFC